MKLCIDVNGNGMATDVALPLDSGAADFRTRMRWKRVVSVTLSAREVVDLMQRPLVRAALQDVCLDAAVHDSGPYVPSGTPVTSRAAAQIAVLQAQVNALQEALIWCSGSNDFQVGGFAREGWVKLCAPLIQAAVDETLAGDAVWYTDDTLELEQYAGTTCPAIGALPPTDGGTSSTAAVSAVVDDSSWATTVASSVCATITDTNTTSVDTNTTSIGD